MVVARTQGSESIIGKGLEKGESVVVDGQTRLVAGAKVEVRAGAPRRRRAPRAPDGAAATRAHGGRAAAADGL